MQHAKALKSRMEAVTAPTAPQGKEILLAGLKDPYFQIRIIALQKLADYELTKEDVTLVEKVAANDDKNLVKSAAIWVLATSKYKRDYIDLYEKALNIASGAVRNAALNALARTNPARAKNFLEKANPADLDADQLSGLTPVIIDNKMEKYLPVIMPYTVYYPFIERDNAEVAANFKKAYDWAMGLDNTELVVLLNKSLKGIAQDMEDPEGKQMLIKALEEGISIKRGLHQTESVKEQIRLLEEIKAMF